MAKTTKQIDDLIASLTEVDKDAAYLKLKTDQSLENLHEAVASLNHQGVFAQVDGSRRRRTLV